MTLRRILIGLLVFLAFFLTLQIKDRRMHEAKLYSTLRHTADHVRFGDEWLRGWCRRAAFPFLP